MPSPIIRPIQSMPGAAKTVAAVTTELIAANELRVFASICNDSDEAMYLAFGEDAVMNSGMRINAAGGSYIINDDNLTLLAVNGICTSGQKNACVIEGT